ALPAHCLHRWRSQPKKVVVAVEKFTLRGVVEPITKEYRVPLCVSTGYFSQPFIRDIANIIKSDDRPTIIGYIGDHDPSGMSIELAAQCGNVATGATGTQRKEGLEQKCPRDYGYDWTWERLAVTDAQFYDMPEELLWNPQE